MKMMMTIAILKKEEMMLSLLTLVFKHSLMKNYCRAMINGIVLNAKNIEISTKNWNYSKSLKFLLFNLKDSLREKEQAPVNLV